MLSRRTAQCITTLAALLLTLAGCTPWAGGAGGAPTTTLVAAPAATPAPLPPAMEEVRRWYVRSDDGSGGARVWATWVTADYLKLDPAAGQGFDPQKQLIFRVAVEAPGLKMSVWDLKGMLYLREEGGKEYGTPVWVPTTGSGTLNGVATFARVDSRGRPVPRAGARYIELVIRDLMGVKERALRWQLP